MVEFEKDGFDDLAFLYNTYEPALSEFYMQGCYPVGSDEAIVVGLVNEIGKTPKKIVFQVKVLSCT